jgi:tRNA(fMet)-specific endonuclease VapC
MRYLLDTNIVSNLVRNPRGRVANRIKAIGEQNICTSFIVAAELRYGTTKKAPPRLSTQVEAVLDAMDTLPFDSPADEIYGSIRTRLESAGTPIGGNDLLIAAQARVQQSDAGAIGGIILPVFCEGSTYTIDPDSSEADALAYWLSSEKDTFVAGRKNP